MVILFVFDTPVFFVVLHVHSGPCLMLLPLLRFVSVPSCVAPSLLRSVKIAIVKTKKCAQLLFVVHVRNPSH